MNQLIRCVLITVTGSALVFTSFCTFKKKTDLLLVASKVYTLTESAPAAEAVAIDKGKVLATGSRINLLSRFHPDCIIEVKQGFIYPGFIDSHCHFYGFARSLQWVDLTASTSFEEVLARISIERTGETSWLIGRGWDQNLWVPSAFPARERLDLLFPDIPVVLVRIDGHVVLANQAALDRAGIGINHRFSKGEVEVVDGKLTGILSENAADYIRSFIPKPSIEQLTGLLQKAQHKCFSAGITGVSDAGLTYETICLFDSLQQAGILKVRIYAMLEPSHDNIRNFILRGPYITDRMVVRSVKLYADGSLGSRTALLKKPYSDDPLKTGILVTSPDSIREICRMAFDHGYQVNTHCIGDSANRIVLEIYREFLQGKNDRRWRIEHAQVVDVADLHMFGDLSVLPSVQATHATSDMTWAMNRLGPERIKQAYAYHDLLEQNGWLTNGTDFPIEKIYPILTFYASVARKDAEGNPPGGFLPENAFSREEALKSITLWAARANFEEDRCGSLEEGKWADLVILDRDLMEIPVQEIPKINVIQTYSHGERVFPLP
jgi:predicted amidohydrolase YtcJ